MENLCDSSRAFWSSISSGVPFSKSIGFFSPGRNISSSRFAMEQIGGSTSPEKGKLGGVILKGIHICVTLSDSPFSGGGREADTEVSFRLFHIPSLTPDTALESCHLPPSMMIR
jgi:hypothetical protein